MRTCGRRQSNRSGFIDKEQKKEKSHVSYRVESMPAVGGVRRTRVFGLYKGADGARVLRSGRTLWIESGDGKSKNQRTEGDDLRKNSVSSRGIVKNYPSNGSLNREKENGWSNSIPLKLDSFPAPNVKREAPIVMANSGERKKSYGVVYVRKRKRNPGGNIGTEKKECLRYSKSHKSRAFRSERCVSVSFDSVSSAIGFESLLLPILNYMKQEGLTLKTLAAYLFSEPVCSVYGSKGIRFMWDSHINRAGICKVFGANERTPLFTVDFSCIPSCFMYMHLILLFQLKNLVVPAADCSNERDQEASSPCSITTEEKIPPQDTDSSRNRIAHPSVRASKLFGRSTQLRIGLNSRGVRKRRSALKQRRGNHSSLGNHSSGSYMNTRSRNAGRKAAPAKTATETIASASWAQGLSVSTDSSTCTANLLVINADKCYRITNVTVTREISDTGNWMLVAKKDDAVFYRHFPQQSMKPCSFNRVTHDVIWSTDETCKLEFPSRQEWQTFKHIFKECSDHNVPSSTTPRVIPVPGVTEVCEYSEDGATFERPPLYISFGLEEVARALSKNEIYEMDSDDEGWLSQQERSYSADTFERMIDAFEKAVYCNPESFSDESAAVVLCADMAEKGDVEGVYRYWINKRKVKKSALLRVFQEHHPKKTPLIPKPALRKKRSSFKRQPSIVGRGKQSELFQAIVAQRDALEERNAMQKVEEAKESARRIVEYAIWKRQEAQVLMENADLAVYKAAMTLKIAEAGRCSDAGDASEGEWC